VEGSCEHGDEPSSSTKFLSSYCLMLRKTRRMTQRRSRCSENPMNVLSGRESEKIETAGCYSVLAVTLRSRLSGGYGGFVIGCATSSEFSRRSDNVRKVSRKFLRVSVSKTSFTHLG
jgi:hypothetical protein